MAALRIRLCRIAFWTAVALTALAVPGLALSDRLGSTERIIEAPAAKGGGIGFVLLVSLQRA